MNANELNKIESNSNQFCTITKKEAFSRFSFPFIKKKTWSILGFAACKVWYYLKIKCIQSVSVHGSTNFFLFTKKSLRISITIKHESRNGACFIFVVVAYLRFKMPIFPWKIVCVFGRGGRIVVRCMCLDRLSR